MNIDSVSEWISGQHMELNTKKCKYMVISRKREVYWLDTGLNLMDTSLERVSTYKYIEQNIQEGNKANWHDIPRRQGKATILAV